MFVSKLSLLNFKNYTEAQFEFCDGINCFTGDNGEGKTNLLDAIHYLSFCKSYFNAVDSQNISFEAPFFVIQAQVDRPEAEATDDVYCGQKRNQKKLFKRNKVEYNRLADHIGLYPLVMVSPADSDLINEGSESRRKFIDTIISQLDRIYLEDLMNYNKIVFQRNALLKRFAETGRFLKDSIEIWDLQLIEFAGRIYQKRSRFIFELIPLFQKYYEELSGGREKVDIVYESHLLDTDFAEVLKSALPRDRAVHYTTVGTHKDDLQFLLRNNLVKKYGSQGQQKTYLIALKLAQYEYIKNHKKQAPWLLLDDIHDKLDADRVKALMHLVSGDHFGQIFITDTDPERIAKLFKSGSIPFKQFHISNGKIVAV